MPCGGKETIKKKTGSGCVSERQSAGRAAGQVVSRGGKETKDESEIPPSGDKEPPVHLLK